MSFIRGYSRRVTEASSLDAAMREADRLRNIIERMEQAGIKDIPRGCEKVAKQVKLQRYDKFKSLLAHQEDDIATLDESIRRDVLSRNHGDDRAARSGDPAGSSKSAGD